MPPDPDARRPAIPSGSWSREPEGDLTIEENWLLRFRRERFRSRKTGLVHDYYVIHLADAVNVIALTPDRRIILVEQFRVGSARDSLETPGGLLDPGEDPLEAGARELLEETGYAGDPPILLGTVWSCPSLLTSRSATILITNAEPVAEPKLDAGEELRIELFPARDVPRLIRNGRIGHALSVQGLLWWLVAELPDTPFSLPEVHRPTRLTIGKLMIAVAAFALVFGLFRALADAPGTSRLPILYALFLPISAFLILRPGDPFPSITLTRSNPRLTSRLLIRLFAILGLNQVLWLVAAILLLLFT